MRQGGQGVDGLAVEQDIQLRQLRGPETVDMIVERCIALGDGLQFIVEINHNLAQRQHEMQLDAIAADILLIDEFTTLVKTKRHDRADIIGSRDDRGTDIGFLDMLNHREVGQTRGVMHFLHLALLGIAHITDVRHGGNDIHVELTVESLLHNLHMEQAKESATEAEAQCY